jgi:hypothetical protein
MVRSTSSKARPDTLVQDRTAGSTFSFATHGGSIHFGGRAIVQRTSPGWPSLTLDLDDKVPDHSTFSVNRQGRFRDSNILRHVFEAVVRACMNAGLVKGEGFAIDVSVMEANASRYHGKAPDEIDWLAPERQTHAVVEFLAAFDDEDSDADRKVPKVVSPVDPSSAWTAKANKRVQFGYGLNYLIDLGPYAVIVDVEGTPARKR